MLNDLQLKTEISRIYEVFDLSLFMGLVLVMILFLLNKKGVRSFQSRLFQRLIVSILVLLAMDDILWLVNGRTRNILYVFTFVYYVLETLPMLLWLCYLDYLINRSMERLKKRWYYIQPLILILLILTASIPSGFIFSVDTAGIYHRGPGIPLIMAINAILLLAPMVLAWRRRSELGGRVVREIVAFGIFPIVGNVGQVMMYETTVLWPSVALAAIFAYFYLENHRDTRDYLTGLYNRQQIDDLVLSRISEYKRRGGFSVVMIDMDGFKAINDRFGHKEGDRALVTMAGILSSAVRSVDAVGRFGGDEFLILLEEDEPERIEMVLQRILSKIGAMNSLSDRDYHLDFSGGWVVFSPEDHPDLETLHRAVDEAMYGEKKQKKRTKPEAPSASGAH